MTNTNQSNSNVPPQIPTQVTLTTGLWGGPGENPEDRIPIKGVLAAVEAVLRQPTRVLFQLRQPRPSRLIILMLVCAVVSGAVYGFVVGTFSGGIQLWAAPVEIAIGLVLSALICLPSLYIFACLSGSHAKPVEVIGSVTAALMLMTILMIGFAPVAWVFSESTESVVFMGALHLLFWFVSALFALRYVRLAIAHSGAHSLAGFVIWAVIFVVVALQMTTALRPLVGTADTFLPTEKKFFLTHWIDCVRAGAPIKNPAQSASALPESQPAPVFSRK